MNTKSIWDIHFCSASSPSSPPSPLVGTLKIKRLLVLITNICLINFRELSHPFSHIFHINGTVFACFSSSFLYHTFYRQITRLFNTRQITIPIHVLQQLWLYLSQQNNPQKVAMTLLSRDMTREVKLMALNKRAGKTLLFMFNSNSFRIRL